MHNLKNLEFHPLIKIPRYSGPAMKVGAGVTVREMYAEAHKNNVSALGGICEVNIAPILGISTSCDG